MRHDDRSAFESWLLGEALIFCLLGLGLALFFSNGGRHHTYDLPQLHLVIQTLTMVAAGVVALLAGIRFSVEGRKLDLFLVTGFFLVFLSTLLFSIGPVLGGQTVHRSEAWAGIASRFLAWSLIAISPFLRGRLPARGRGLGNAVVGSGCVVFVVWGVCHALAPDLPDLSPGRAAQPPFMLTGALAAQALLNLGALVGFGKRFYERGDDLYRWLALGATLMLFSSLHYIFTPLVTEEGVSQGDFLRVLGYGVLLVGVWRAIRAAEFGRAVAEERARVAREIHDGLAQYLFAISTHVTMLEHGTKREETVSRLKEAALAAQQEARFAVLALSSASGTAPFGAALRRYVEFLTADGKLEVELEIDESIRLAPDEQIEVFRIVQEGLANVRKHANARRAWVTIGERDDQRIVSIRDDGDGFDDETSGAGQGLKNIRARTESIAGGFTLRSGPGMGTALEVVLRT